jgi:hypothetical protein
LDTRGEVAGRKRGMDGRCMRMAIDHYQLLLTEAEYERHRDLQKLRGILAVFGGMAHHGLDHCGG